MSAKVWVLIRQENRDNPTWANYYAVSKTAWQKIARAYSGNSDLALRYSWLAEGTKKEVEGYLTLLGGV